MRHFLARVVNWMVAAFLHNRMGHDRVGIKHRRVIFADQFDAIFSQSVFMDMEIEIFQSCIKSFENVRPRFKCDIIFLIQ